MRQWYKTKPTLLEQLKAEVQSEYPNLNFYTEKDIVFIRGSFPIIHERKILDRYSIEIEFPYDYPKSIPIVREIGGRIPRTAEWHMNARGEACLFVPDERWWLFPPEVPVRDFINGPVHDFFLGQSLAQMGEPWPFGQRPHGVKGIREFYSNLLKTDDLTTIINYVRCLNKPSIKGHWDCPCGSGKRIRNCHFDQLLDLSKKIPSRIAEPSWKRLTSEKG